jgi:cobalamin biosynthesis protein CbiG
MAYRPEVATTGRLVVGLGARAGVPEQELAEAIDIALRQAGLEPAEIAGLATLDRRAAEAGVRAVAHRRGWSVLTFDAARLAGTDVPNPSGTVAAAAGTASVAEAAALLGAGPGAVLVLAKTVFARSTVAIARTSGSHP